MTRLIKRGWQAWWTGLLVLVPATTTLYILWKLLNTLDLLGHELLGSAVADARPGVSLILLILLILLVGISTTHLLGHHVVRWAEQSVEHIPLVRTIYLTLKGMTDLFNFRSRFGRSTVVLFPFPRDRVWALGLVMGSAPTPIEKAVGPGLLMIFVPTAIHPFTGYLAFVPREVTATLSLPVEEAMKVEFSAGLYRPESGWLGIPPPTPPGPPR